METCLASLIFLFASIIPQPENLNLQKVVFMGPSSLVGRTGAGANLLHTFAVPGVFLPLYSFRLASVRARSSSGANARRTSYGRTTQEGTNPRTSVANTSVTIHQPAAPPFSSEARPPLRKSKTHPLTLDTGKLAPVSLRRRPPCPLPSSRFPFVPLISRFSYTAAFAMDMNPQTGFFRKEGANGSTLPHSMLGDEYFTPGLHDGESALFSFLMWEVLFALSYVASKTNVAEPEGPDPF